MELSWRGVSIDNDAGFSEGTATGSVELEGAPTQLLNGDEVAMAMSSMYLSNK